jgi:hypothetical protein
LWPHVRRKRRRWWQLKALFVAACQKEQKTLILVACHRKLKELHVAKCNRELKTLQVSKCYRSRKRCLLLGITGNNARTGRRNTTKNLMFESRRGHECLFRVSCSWQVEVCASGWSLVQRSPTECGVSECDPEDSTMRRPWPTGGYCALKEKI